MKKGVVLVSLQVIVVSSVMVFAVEGMPRLRTVESTEALAGKIVKNLERDEARYNDNFIHQVIFNFFCPLYNDLDKASDAKTIIEIIEKILFFENAAVVLTLPDTEGNRRPEQVELSKLRLTDCYAARYAKDEPIFKILGKQIFSSPLAPIIRLMRIFINKTTIRGGCLCLPLCVYLEDEDRKVLKDYFDYFMLTQLPKVLECLVGKEKSKSFYGFDGLKVAYEEIVGYLGVDSGQGFQYIESEVIKNLLYPMPSSANEE